MGYFFINTVFHTQLNNITVSISCTILVWVVYVHLVPKCLFIKCEVCWEALHVNVTLIIVRAVNVRMLKLALLSHVNVPVNGTVKELVSNSDLEEQ